MLKAEDFRKCQEARRLELEKQKKAEKEQLIKDQLELVDKQLNEAYKNIANKKLSIDTKCVDVHENLLPETIEELNKLGYYVEKSFSKDGNVKAGDYVYFEIPKNEKKIGIDHLNDDLNKYISKVYSTKDIPKGERDPMTIKYNSISDNGEKKESLKVNDKEIDLDTLEKKKQNLIDELIKDIFRYHM